MARNKTWHDDVFFGLHFDLHAGAGDTVLGSELTHEHLRERLERVKPDWIQCDCKGHPGYTSWPTKVGSTSPGVVRDALRIHRDVTRELGIPLVMHYSGVWDSRALELHPEWAVIDAQGKASPNATCRLSAYRDELLIPQLIELVRDYEVDGFWVDGENWASAPCWCERCLAEWAKRSGGLPVPRSAEDAHWDAWLAMARDLFTAYVTAYTDAVHAVNPNCTVCSNWMYTVRQPEPVSAPVDYLSGDYDWIWSTDRAAVEGRVLDGRGLSWDLMAWGFTKTGDHHNPMPWSTKPVVHLCQELAEVVALGGAVEIYQPPQRTGWIVDWHMDTFGDVGRFCRERRELCWHSTSRSQAVIWHLVDSYYAANDPLYNYGGAVQPIEGALHMLLETGRSTDILTEADAVAATDGYRLVVLPEATRLSPEVQAALEAFAAGGGQVILTGAHLASEVPALVGATPAGEPIESLYLAVDGMAAPVYGGWQPVAAAAGVEVVAGAMSQPEVGKEADLPTVVTRRAVGHGAITAIHGPLFRNYFQAHFPLVRRWFAGLVADLGIDWEVTLDAPARLEPIVRELDGRLTINLLNRGAGEMLMPRRVIVEELAPVLNAVVTVRCPEPRGLLAVPEDPMVRWQWADGLLTLRLPRVDVHTVVAIEPR
ncbi:MAG: hypothetical protein HZB16_22905 [Armatimonadetes bacterium]|nr:hypothetical protein [Armatimonadota bacterium]